MFLHTYHPDPILLNIGPVSIYWYGLLVVVAIIIGFFICLKLGKRIGANREHFCNLLFPTIIAGLIGARLYHVFCEFSYYWQNPIEILKIWQGGLGIFGAIGGGILVIFWYCKDIQTVSFRRLADIIFVALPLGQAIVRWGNYFNQELFGLPTNLAWGIPIDFINRPLEYLNFTHFHPVFLYESIWNLIVFIILISIFYHRTSIRGGMPPPLKRDVFLYYLILYPLGRFFISFFRIDPQPIIANLRLDQFICLVLIVISIFLIWSRKYVAFGHKI